MRFTALGVSLVFLCVACGQSAEMSGNNKTKKDKRDVAAKGDDSPVDIEKVNGVTPIIEGTGEVTQYGVERSFNTLDTSDESLTYDPRSNYFEEKITLGHTIAPGSKTLGQTERMPVTKEFQQGASGSSRQETFAQNAMGVLDVVVVIDNSGSMSQEQTNLSGKLDPLLNYVKESDWQVNVVTTDPANGCSRALIKRGDTNANAAFAAAVNAGIAGSGNEQGIRQAVAALSCTTPAWLRANSSLAVLIVSDEDNCSNGAGCPAPYNSPNHLLNYMTATLGRTLITNARVYGLIWIPTQACATGGSKGNQYMSAITQTSGVAGSICDADYTNTLRAISENFASILKAQFTLAVTPDAGSLQVKVNGSVTTNYTLSGKTVTFTTPPPAGATIVANYVIGSTPILTQFPLGQKPAAGTLSVRVGGVVAPSNSYSVNTNNELVFPTAPAASSNIRASFRADTALPKNFPFAVNTVPGTVKVKVNGFENTNFTQTVTELVFNTAPTDNAVIEVTYDEDMGPKLVYDTAGGSNTTLISIVDTATGDAIAGATLVGKKLTITAASYADGRSLTLRYRDEKSAAHTVLLADAPLADSLAVDGQGCSVTSTQAMPVGGPLVTLDCADLNPVTITYRRAVSRLDTFELPEVTTPEAGIWEVYLDDQPVLGFVREGIKVTLPEALSTQLLNDTENHVVKVAYTSN